MTGIIYPSVSSYIVSQEQILMKILMKILMNNNIISKYFSASEARSLLYDYSFHTKIYWYNNVNDVIMD